MNSLKGEEEEDFKINSKFYRGPVWTKMLSFADFSTRAFQFWASWRLFPGSLIEVNYNSLQTADLKLPADIDLTCISK